MNLYQRKHLIVIVIALALLLTAGTALAGNWATIEIDDLPGEIRAGETVHLSFLVLQHGQTPAHTFDNGRVDITPVFSALNEETGEELQVTAVAEKAIGRYSLAVSFPSEGTWSWSIAPDPLQGMTEFDPLTVLAAASSAASAQKTLGSALPVAAPAAENPGTSEILPWAAALLLSAGMAGALLGRRRKITLTSG